MLNVALIVLGLLVALMLLVVVLASMRPSVFRTERSTVIAAPAEAVFPLIQDFHGWSRWSPWEKLDPKMKKTYAGPQAGVGSVYEWDGNGQVGAGRAEIIEATAPGHVTVQLDYRRPFKGRNTAEFALVPDNGQTRVTWSVHGPMAFPARVMGLFLDMDKMIGSQFESGLAGLKAIVES